MGRGSSGANVAFQRPTNARDIGNMNEAQIDREIAKQQRIIASAQNSRAKYSSQTAEERALQEQYPLGSGGLSRSAAERLSGRLGDQALNRGRNLEQAIQRQNTAENRLEQLRDAKNEIHNTGMTRNEMREAQRVGSREQSTMTWKTTQKQERVGASLKPRVISSGNYEIRGTSILRVYRDGKQIGTASKLADAKDIAERDRRRRR